VPRCRAHERRHRNGQVDRPTGARGRVATPRAFAHLGSPVRLRLRRDPPSRTITSPLMLRTLFARAGAELSEAGKRLASNIAPHVTTRTGQDDRAPVVLETGRLGGRRERRRAMRQARPAGHRSKRSLPCPEWSHRGTNGHIRFRARRRGNRGDAALREGEGVKLVRQPSCADHRQAVVLRAERRSRDDWAAMDARPGGGRPCG
jgi:hypothetical protein